MGRKGRRWGLVFIRMTGFKAWFSSSGWSVVVAGIWFFAWLLGFTNGNASSSVYMLPVALTFLVLGLTQRGQEKRRSGG